MRVPKLSNNVFHTQGSSYYYESSCPHSLRLFPRQLSFNVSIVNDSIPEDDEMFRASLTLDPADRARPGNCVTMSPNVATVTIQDSDGKSTSILHYYNNSLIVEYLTHSNDHTQNFI